MKGNHFDKKFSLAKVERDLAKGLKANEWIQNTVGIHKKDFENITAKARWKHFDFGARACLTVTFQCYSDQVDEVSRVCSDQEAAELIHCGSKDEFSKAFRREYGDVKLKFGYGETTIRVEKTNRIRKFFVAVLDPNICTLDDIRLCGKNLQMACSPSGLKSGKYEQPARGDVALILEHKRNLTGIGVWERGFWKCEVILDGRTWVNLTARFAVMDVPRSKGVLSELSSVLQPSVRMLLRPSNLSRNKIISLTSAQFDSIIKAWWGWSKFSKDKMLTRAD